MRPCLGHERNPDQIPLQPAARQEGGVQRKRHGQSTPTNLIVRFVVLEKNLSSYFERPYLPGSKTVEEETILQGLDDLQSTDLHKGIKKLWDEGFMDCPRTKYKKPISTAFEAMDEAKGIKENAPELYEILKDALLFNSLFEISKDQESYRCLLLGRPIEGPVGLSSLFRKKGGHGFCY